MEKIEIMYHDGTLPIERIPQGDWIDLRAAEDVELRMLEDYKISLGVSMKLPEGYEAHVVPRSGTFSRWGIILVNGIGIIDNSYSGPNDIWKFHALCMKNYTKIYKGDRICQFRIFKKQPEWEAVTTDMLKGEDRGGFGSTGVR